MVYEKFYLFISHKQTATTKEDDGEDASNSYCP